MRLSIRKGNLIPCKLIVMRVTPIKLRGCDRFVSLSDGRVAKDLNPGYRIVPALSCALDGKSIPTSLRKPAPTSYYPSTLYLLALSIVAQKYSVCL